ncbi:MAG: hypothetical protein ACN6O6_02145 [Pseudomonas sp.]|uniref:hypothetical protein n=1 Tax=Pseudomonas sp. TaxID=306 RepID=UPI003D0D8A00
MRKEIFEIIAKKPLSDDLNLDTDFVLHIREHDSREDERDYKPIDLKRYWLPANTVYDEPSRFIDRLNYLAATLYALDYFSRTNLPSNSKCNRMCFMLASIIKFLEYCWLNNCHDLKLLSQDFLLHLAKRLSINGWHKALDINSRLTTFLNRANDPTHPLFNSQNANQSLSTSGFQLALATNISGKEVNLYFNRVRHFQVIQGWRKDFRKNSATSEGMKYSLLRQTLESINLTYHAIEPFRPNSIPYENYVKLAKSLTAPPGTTEDINSYDAGLLLEYSLDLQQNHSTKLLRLISFAAKELQKKRNPAFNSLRIQRFARRLQCLPASGITPCTPHELISHLNTSIRNIANACFVIIAIFNARRKKEITHKKYGVSMGSGTLLGENSNIYLQRFYIEKTVKDYVQFYIGPSTKNAITTLEKLQLALHNKPFKNHKYSNHKDPSLTLFRLRYFNQYGLSDSVSQFDFETSDPAMSGNFILAAIQKPLRLTPHMFRRLYCKIFINRFEYFMLPTLSYQLQHEDIGTTQIYISNPQSQAESAEISKLYDWNTERQSEALVAHNEEILMGMAEASREKFSEIVYRCISEKNSSGGYTKLVRSLYQKMFSSVEYSIPDTEKLQTIIDRLKHRGHSPQAFKHAQCLAGSNRIKSKSKCWQKSDNKLHKENAGPKLCHNCMFSWTSEEHIKGLETDLNRMINDISDQPSLTILRRNQEYEIEELNETIQYHKEYLTRRHENP